MSDIDVSDQGTQGEQGTVPVRVYRAVAPDGSGLLWLHGGAFLAGDLDMPEADHVARRLATAGTTVISVDYRLAVNGVRYPVPLDDVLTAWEWAWGHREELGIHALAIGGASAGGNLAAAASLRLAGTDRAPALVVLAYPTLLAVQDTYPPLPQFDPALVRQMYENYTGLPAEDATADIAPALASAAELSAYPATVIVDADLDPLRVSAERFAATLSDAGRSVELITEPGSRHGFLNEPDDPACERALAWIGSHLAAAALRSR